MAITTIRLREKLRGFDVVPVKAMVDLLDIIDKLERRIAKLERAGEERNDG